MRRTDSPEKTLMLGKIEGRKRRGRYRMRRLDDKTYKDYHTNKQPAGELTYFCLA